MPEKTVYISYRPHHSLHIAQPLFNELRQQGYDVFMDINEGIDDVNLHQIGARAHFLMILTPHTLDSIDKPDDRLRQEFDSAQKHRRNIVLLLAKDFEFPHGAFSQQIQSLPQIRMQPKQFDEMVRLLDEIYLQVSPQQPAVPAPDDELAIVQARIDEARNYTQQTTIRLNTEKQFFAAVVKIRQGDFDGALGDLDLVIADNPNNESAYLQRGRVLRKKGRKTAALKDYEQATRLSPKLVVAHIGRGELLLESGRNTQALEAFQHALDLQADNAPAIAGMALTLHALNQTGDALKMWGTLIDRDENYTDPQWTGEVFDWTAPLVQLARDLLGRR